jgi:hypothetical protein
MRAAAVVLIAAMGASCAKPPPPAAKGAVFDVYRGKRQVLIVRNEPGKLTSTLELGPGESWPDHPFLSADATAPEEENRIGVLLRRSAGFDEFLQRLREAGYEVKPRNLRKI